VALEPLVSLGSLGPGPQGSTAASTQESKGSTLQIISTDPFTPTCFVPTYILHQELGLSSGAACIRMHVESVLGKLTLLMTSSLVADRHVNNARAMNNALSHSVCLQLLEGRSHFSPNTMTYSSKISHIDKPTLGSDCGDLRVLRLAAVWAAFLPLWTNSTT
jgi:hypothetical protein